MTNTPNYINQINWISTEPSLLAWQIKTQAHQVKGLEYFCILILLLCAISAVIGVIVFFIPSINPLASFFFIGGGSVIACIFSMALFGEVRRKVWLVYRTTATSVECYYWRAYPKGLFKTIRGLFIWGGGLLIIIGLITNLGLMVLAGPVSIVIGLASVATTKEYQEAMINFSYNGFMWVDVKTATYDEKRQVIDIYFDHVLSEKERQDTIAEGRDPDMVIAYGHMYLFPTPDITTQLIQQVEQKLPRDIPLNRNKVKLPTVV